MRFKSYLFESIGKKIYLDMDGVLTDFQASFKKIDGRTTEQVEKEGDKSFWDHVDKGGLEFWSKMPWTKTGKQLWNYVKNKNVAILSSPARSLPNSIKGKYIWIGRELGSIDVNLKRAREKQELASSESILIDDLPKNIKQWKASGGHGILFKNAGQAIKELKKLGV